MGFLAPALLYGTAAVSVPVALHFLFKARPRPLPWAAMEFLRKSVELTSRRLKFQELVLLLLRCLGVLLLALALARPSCSALTVGRSEGVDAVLAFDLSYSMGARDGELTRFERAKLAAEAVLDGLPANSTAQVVTFAGRAASVGPVSPSNLDQARQIIRGLELSSQSGDALQGLSEAIAALERGSGSAREVYLFTDLQMSDWDRQSGALRGKAEELRDRPAAMIFVRCCNPDASVRNIAVTDITFPGDIPHADPHLPTRLPVTVMLRNTGTEPVRDTTVTLEVDGRSQEAESGLVPTVEPGHAFPIVLSARLDKPGQTLLTARVSADGLPGDNRLDRIVSVRDRVRVLVVDGDVNPTDPRKSGSHFLVNALRPVPESQQDGYFVKVTVVPTAEAKPGLLRNADMCLLSNVPARANDQPGTPGLPPTFVEALAPFVKNGGGLVIGGGTHVSPRSYNAVFGSGGLGLLPFDLFGISHAPPDDPMKPAPESTESPSFLSKLREEPFRTTTADVDLTGLLTVGTNGPKGGRVVMRTTDDLPWITRLTYGEGEIVFVGTSLDASWTNWPAKAGSYVSFMRFALAHLTGKGSRGANLVAGQPLVYFPAQTESAAPFEILRPPDGRRARAEPARPGHDGKPAVNYTDTSVAGVYRVMPKGEEIPDAPRYAVAPDLRESDNLELLSDEALEVLLGFRPVIVTVGNGADPVLAVERSGRELTVWVLLAAFAVLIAEMAWAWVCGRAW